MIKGEKMIKILALDCSTKHTGWAIFEGRLLKEHGDFVCNSKVLFERIDFMKNKIREVLEKHPDVMYVFLEEVYPETKLVNVKTNKALMWLQGAVAREIYEFNHKIDVQYIYPSAWRQACGIKTGRGIKREGLKEKDIAFAKESFQVDVNDDVADAIGIGFAAAKMLSHDFVLA